MPTMDFLKDYVEGENENDISYHFSALMHYPNDSQLREKHFQLQKNWHAQKMARSMLGEPVAYRTEDEGINFLLSTYDDPSPDEALSHYGILAGMRLHYALGIETVSGRGSLNNARALMVDRYYKNQPLTLGESTIPVSAGTIDTAWKRLGSVAHLWAGYAEYPEVYGHDRCLQNPSEFMSLVEMYRQSGEWLKPKGARTYILDPKQTWKPPIGHLSFGYGDGLNLPFNAHEEFPIDELKFVLDID